MSNRAHIEPAVPFRFGGHDALDFVNTVDSWVRPFERDYIETFEKLVAWSWQVGLIDASKVRSLIATPPRIAAAAHREALALRDSLLHVFGAIIDDEAPRQRRYAGPECPARRGTRQAGFDSQRGQVQLVVGGRCRRAHSYVIGRAGGSGLARASRSDAAETLPGTGRVRLAVCRCKPQRVPQVVQHGLLRQLRQSAAFRAGASTITLTSSSGNLPQLGSTQKSTNTHLHASGTRARRAREANRAPCQTAACGLRVDQAREHPMGRRGTSQFVGARPSARDPQIAKEIRPSVSIGASRGSGTIGFSM